MTYLNFPVFPYNIKPLNTIQQTISHDRKFIGKQWQHEYYFYLKSEQITMNLLFNFETYEELNTLKQFFFNTKGKVGKFWLPTWNNDLIPLLDAYQDTNSIIVEQKYLDVFKEIHRPMVLYFPNHNFVTFATNIVDTYNSQLGHTVNQITLNDNLPFSLQKSGCTPIQFLFFGRFNTDIISFEFIDLFRGQCSLSFKEATRIDYKKYLPDLIYFE